MNVTAVGFKGLINELSYGVRGSRGIRFNTLDIMPTDAEKAEYRVREITLPDHVMFQQPLNKQGQPVPGAAYRLNGQPVNLQTGKWGYRRTQVPLLNYVYSQLVEIPLSDKANTAFKEPIEALSRQHEFPLWKSVKVLP